MVELRINLNQILAIEHEEFIANLNRKVQYTSYLKINLHIQIKLIICIYYETTFVLKFIDFFFFIRNVKIIKNFKIHFLN